MARNTISILISAKDEASKVLKGVSEDFKDTTEHSKKFAKAAMAGGAMVAAGIGASVKVASDFETQMGNIATLTGGSATDAFNDLVDSILEMSKRVPKTADDLGAAAYDILSAGVEGSANQLHVLEESAKLATAGLSDTGEATDIMTSAINAFQLPAEDADKIADVLFKTVKNGKTTVAEMSQAFGATAPVVSAAGISLEEFSAATAALTTTGQPATKAQNSLRQSVVSLSKPTKEMSELLEKAGFESGAAAMENLGLVETMDALNEAAGGNEEMLARAYGSVEALGAATSLTGNQAEAFADTWEDMAGGANAVEEAFETQKETAGAAMTMLKNEAIAAGISFGQRFLPHVTTLAEMMTDNVIPALKNTARFLDENRIVLAIVAGAILAAVVPAFISWGVAAASAALATLAALAPLLLIGAAVGAFAYLVVSNWEKIKEVTTGVFTAVFDFIGEKVEWLKNNWASGIGFMIGFVATLPIKLPIYIFRAVTKIIDVIRNVNWGAVWDTVRSSFTGAVGRMWEAIKGLFGRITGLDWGQIFKNAAKGIGNSILGLLEGAINGALSGLPTSPSVNLPRFAKGVRNFEGGAAIVGEEGAELVHLPRGSSVIPHRETNQIMSERGGSVTQKFDVKVYNQFDLKQAMREAGYMLAR